MIPPWAYFNEQERVAFRTTQAFLRNRLTESVAIDWALQLGPADRIQRVAVEMTLSGADGSIDEPWCTAWRLIEEGWSESPAEEGPSTAIYGIQKRLRAGDRSGSVISAILNLVAPRLKVKPIEAWHWRFMKKPRHPRTFSDLLSASISSGDLVDLNVLGLGDITDVPFLKALANGLERVMLHGLDVASRLGWDGRAQLWRLGGLRRVRYVGQVQYGNEDRDPDAHHHGIAPSVKLLDAVVTRLAHLDLNAALRLVRGWRLVGSPIHIRLWAAAGRSAEMVTVAEVAEFFHRLDDREFWDLHAFPEIAELRAARFSDLDQPTQNTILTRIRKGPPRDHWPKKAEAREVKNARLYWAVRELKRIEVVSGELPSSIRPWLVSQISKFPELQNMGVEEGFLEGGFVRWVPPDPDDRFDTLKGLARLRALEVALATSRVDRNDDPAERANDWLRQPNKIASVVTDLSVAIHSGNEFPNIWNRLGWVHSPRQSETMESRHRHLQGEADRVLALLNQLSDDTLSAAIEGVSNWMETWRSQVVASPLGLPVWLRVWPFAVAATNAGPELEDTVDLSVTAFDDDREPFDLDTLSTPVGKLVGVFLESCPLLEKTTLPFADGSPAQQMRNIIIVASERSGLIARHRLIEELPYFLRADPAWTKHNLIASLLDNGDSSLPLWRAVARRTHFTEMLRIIGNAMIERATDRRLGRETRRSLVFSLVIESLHAFREHRDPAAPNSRIAQMLRIVDDEVRAHAANSIQRFVHDLPRKGAGDKTVSSAEVFQSAAAPFLRDVWPQERSLATPGVSGALADLPATSGDAFAEAVDAIERFLLPFECWSMINYGLYGDEGETKRLAMINDERKAKAFLRLLNLTIGSSEIAVVPLDLTDALDQIQSVAPYLAESAIYRRLAASARR